jgi:hypothetical protein
MQQAMDFIEHLIFGLLALIMTGIAAIEIFLRGVMGHAGVGGQMQSIVLIVVAIFLIIAALRAFGGIIGLLVTVFLILLMMHVLVPGLHVPSYTRV